MKTQRNRYLVALMLLASCVALRAQTQITLPSPIVRETFESVDEGKLPPGWSVQNFTDDGTAGEDLNDPKSDSYKNWVVITRDRVQAIGDAGAWEAPRRLAVAGSQFINGVLVTNLTEGKFIYAESDNRGGSQVQYMFSPDFDLTGKVNVFLFFNSIYEQNQDSIGSVEYSIDQGANWLPILYMLDGPDIVRGADGSIDGYATMNNENADTASRLDAVTGDVLGRKYGAFIGVSSNKWSTLAPFISARVNDDGVESKRIELFKLPQADNQAKVRFRFAQAGTGSWYFGIDNFGLYSIEQVKPTRPTISAPGTVGFFGDAVFTGSAFKPAAAGQTHSVSVWQISESSSATPEKGLASILESYTSAKNLTSLPVKLGRVRPGKTYYATVQYKDKNGAGSDFAEPIAFTVSGSLPTPIFFEDFESTAEGSVPAGWKVDNQTDGATGAADPADPRSDTYLNWAVASFDTLASFGGERVNDTNVLSGKSIYAESDTRTGNQIQYLATPDINLAGKKDVWLVFKSNYEQNQDSFGGLEYSVDAGTTWLPLMYLIDQGDIITGTDGSVDAVKTLTTTYGDVAKVIDPATADRVAAGKYADFILAKPIESLGAFISPRINDNTLESKRIERFRLAAADNQAKVRVRFVQAGTGSWFWGLDDVGLYSVAPEAPARTKPDAPQIALPKAASFFENTLAFSGSAFTGIQPKDTNAKTVLQISGTSGFNATTGLSNVLASVTDAKGATAVSIPTTHLFPGQTYYATMQYEDANGVKSDFSTPSAFTVDALPAPVALENFDSTPDFGVPTGWTVSNQTDANTAGLAPADPKSDTYKDWVVVPFSTLEAFGGSRADASVATGKSIYAESDNRGGNQIQVLVSPSYDLRGKSNVRVAFKSNYVQNQDSIGVFEYSVDGGTTWLPALYMINDKPSNTDIVRVNGNIDAAKTLTTTAGDIAKVIDPATGQRVAAGKYADFIKAGPIDSLAPYISGRIDDDKTESRRYERFQLPAAANQAQVSFRFVQSGTGSWWWGIDDFGIYAEGSGAPAAGKTLLSEGFDDTDTAGLVAKGWILGKNEFATETGTEFVVAPPYATATPEKPALPGTEFSDASGAKLVNPPGERGIASTGKYLISDSDSAGLSDDIDSKSEFFAITPSFSTVGLTEAWFHADAEIEANNNGEDVVELAASIDNGTTWIPMWQSVEPQRVEKSVSKYGNYLTGGERTGGYPEFGSASQTKTWSGIHGRWHVKLPSAALNKANVKIRIEYFEPADAWWIALDNVVIDNNPPPQGKVVVLSEAFDSGIPATWKKGTKKGQNWGTEPLKDAAGAFLLKQNDVPINVDIVREAAARGVAKADILNPDKNTAFDEVNPNGGGLDGKWLMMLAGGNYALWQEGPDVEEQSTLDTPALNLADADGVFIEFDSEIVQRNASAVNEVFVSADNGATFQRIFTYNGALGNRGEAPYFMKHYIAVPEAVKKNNVIFRFSATGGDPDRFQGFWAIDNVRVSANKASTPPSPIQLVGAGDGLSIKLTWTGGEGPFLVQAATDIAGPWIDLVTTTERSSKQPFLTSATFFRIVDKTTKTVTQYHATLSGASENPATTTTASGTASISFDGDKVTYFVAYSGLSAAASAGHFHGPAAPTENAGVLLGFADLTPKGTEGLFGAVGVALPPALKTAIETGKAYANIHTSKNPGGEIRGQILP